MVINFVGNFTTGYVGEAADQVHLAREMEALGHVVRRIPQDEWREHVIDKTSYPHVPSDLTADINIITKWHHFYNSDFIFELRKRSNAPVFYWVWDYMYDHGIPDWHFSAVNASDLYLGNDVRSPFYRTVSNTYYFPFDVCDGELPVFRSHEKKYDVIFTGSCIGQGHRQEWIREIAQKVPLSIFSWNHLEWPKWGADAVPAVYGMDYNKIISESKVVLGFSVEPTCWGYWSNRVGKVLRAGGVLVYEYAPGMELLLGDAVDYFSTPGEAVERINFWLTHEDLRAEQEKKARLAGEKFTSKERIKQLMILIDRYLKTGGKDWKV